MSEDKLITKKGILINSIRIPFSLQNGLLNTKNIILLKKSFYKE